MKTVLSTFILFFSLNAFCDYQSEIEAYFYKGIYTYTSGLTYPHGYQIYFSKFPATSAEFDSIFNKYYISLDNNIRHSVQLTVDANSLPSTDVVAFQYAVFNSDRMQSNNGRLVIRCKNPLKVPSGAPDPMRIYYVVNGDCRLFFLDPRTTSILP